MNKNTDVLPKGRILMDRFKYCGFYGDNDSHANDRLHDVKHLTINYLFDKYLPKEGKVLNTSANNASYAVELAEKGYSVTVTEPSDENLALIRSNPKANLLQSIDMGTPIDLSAFSSESFDILISLRTMYRLTTHAERELFVRESLRVLKQGGYFVFSFMTPFALTHNQHMAVVNSPNNPSDKIKAYRKLAKVEKTHIFDNFYGMTQEEISDLCREYKIDIVSVASTYEAMNALDPFINDMSDEEFKEYMDCQYAICEDPAVTRYCLRGLFIGRKKKFDLFDW